MGIISRRERAPVIKDRFSGLPDVFSHSAQCDAFFSKLCDLITGEPHPACACWCHVADLADEPPEYLIDDLDKEREL